MSGVRGVRVGLVGLGRVAEVGYLPAIRSLEDVDLVGVADVRPGRAELLAPGVPAYASTDELLTAGLELLVVATPASRHLVDATCAASAGVRALVEKPAVETLAEAQALAALVPAPWLGQDRRFDERAAHLRDEVASFAAPLDVRLAMSVLPASWGAFQPGAGPLFDLGPHVVDLARWLSREEIVAVHGARSAEGDVRFELELGESVARVAVSHDRPWSELVEVRGACGGRARLVRGGLSGRVAAMLRRPGQSPLVVTLSAQLRAACMAVRTGSADVRLATPEDGVALLGALEAVTASAADGGRRVHVEGRAVASSLR